MPRLYRREKYNYDTGRRGMPRLYRRQKMTLMASNELFMDKYRIASARAPWHQYNGGHYFITICTQDKVHYFGHIENDTMTLSAIGKIVDGVLRETSNHQPFAQIVTYVVMPNHIHFILSVDTQLLPEDMRDGKSSPVATVVGSIKSSVTREARKLNPYFAWQARYYDHIIRSTKEAAMINSYIVENVARWQMDKFFSSSMVGDAACRVSTVGSV